VVAGRPLVTLFADEPERFERAFQALEGAYAVDGDDPPPLPLVIDRIDAAGT